jgi:hypothetical protein
MAVLMGFSAEIQGVEYPAVAITPSPNPLQDGFDRLVQGRKIDAVAFAITRYQISHSGRIAMKLLKHIGSHRKTQDLILFRTMGSRPLSLAHT